MGATILPFRISGPENTAPIDIEISTGVLGDDVIKTSFEKAIKWPYRGDAYWNYISTIEPNPIDSCGLFGDTDEKPYRPDTFPGNADNHTTMTGPTREEIDAKLQAVEARMDTRVAEVVGRIDSLLVSQQGLDRIYQKQFSDLAAAQEAQKTQAEEAKKEQLKAINEAQKSSTDDIKSLKRTIAVAGIGTALTVLFGIAAFNATLLSNMIASFESGKNTMQSVNQVTNQLNETAKKLADLEAKLEAQKAVATQPVPSPSPQPKP